MKSSVVYAAIWFMHVGKIWDNDLTESDLVSGLIISLWNFKKPWDILSPQIERKRSKEYLVIILAVKESFERFSCLEFIFEESKHREAGLKRKQGFQRHFNICLREWKLLSLYMFHRIIFLLLIVSSLFCNFYRCAVCFQSLMNIACMQE